jgi:hypothetical protein
MPSTNVGARRGGSLGLRNAVLGAVPYIGTALLCVFILFNIYDLSRAGLRIPLGQGADSDFYQALIKNFVETGHYYVNDRLGAPGVQELYDFPLPHTSHLVFLSVLRIFSRNFGLVLNLFYLLGFPLAAMTALGVFRQFGIPAILGVAGGTLFAFLPYHLFRNQQHLFLSSYYLVPLGIMVVLWVSQGHALFGFEAGQTGIRALLPTRRGWVSLGICALVGSDNPYYAFFTGIFLVVGALLACLRHRRRRALFSAGILGCSLAAVLLMNLLPSLYYIHTHGPNPIAQRNPAEAEVFGLKIVQLVAPVTFHRLAALAEWKRNYNVPAPFVNENDMATLGVVGTVGFLALLAMFFGNSTKPLLYSLSVFNLWAVLVGTIGGFGSLFSFAVYSQFRAYNRISIFIAFFSFMAVLILSERLIRRTVSSSRQWLGLAVASLVLVVIGLGDLIPVAFTGVPPDRQGVKGRYRADQAFVAQIENSLPAGSMIFQLPYVAFPGGGNIYHMWEYEQVWGYIHSRSLRWSFGSMRGRPVDRWIARVSQASVSSMVSAVATAGFAGIAIDRQGYPDSAASLEAQLRGLLGIGPLVSQNGQFSFFRLDSAAIDAMRRREVSDEKSPLGAPADFAQVDTGAGCWPREGTDQDNWHWCDANGEIVVSNNRNTTSQVAIDAVIMTGHPEMSHMVITGPGFVRKLNVNNGGAHVRLELPIGFGDQAIHIQSDAPKVDAPSDPRHMVFRLNNLIVREIKQ